MNRYLVTIAVLSWGLVGIGVVTVAQDRNLGIEGDCGTEPKLQDIELENTDISSYLLKSDYLICQNRLSEAAEVLNQIVKYRSESLKDELSSLYLPLGEVLQKNQEWQQAIDTYRFALEGMILDGSEYDALGYALVKYDRLEPAVRAFSKLGEHLGHTDGKAFGYTRLGDGLREEQRWEEAQIAYEKAIELDSKEAFAYEGLGLVWMEKEEWEKAISAFEEALELHPTLTSVKEYLQQVQDLQKHKKLKL